MKEILALFNIIMIVEVHVVWKQKSKVLKSPVMIIPD